MVAKGLDLVSQRSVWWPTAPHRDCANFTWEAVALQSCSQAIPSRGENNMGPPTLWNGRRARVLLAGFGLVLLDPGFCLFPPRLALLARAQYGSAESGWGLGCTAIVLLYQLAYSNLLPNCIRGCTIHPPSPTSRGASFTSSGCRMQLPTFVANQRNPVCKRLLWT